MTLVIQSYFSFLMSRETRTVKIIFLFIMRELRLKGTMEILQSHTTVKSNCRVLGLEHNSSNNHNNSVKYMYSVYRALCLHTSWP